MGICCEKLYQDVRPLNIVPIILHKILDLTTKIVDYVLFSRENREIVTTFLYFPNEDLTYEQWLNKTRSTLEKDNKSTQFNYDEYDKYLEYKNISKYKQSSRYEPYYKVRYDIIARNIIIFGATLASLFIIIKLKQTAK